MPAEQFAQAVRGSGGRPIQTAPGGAIETDNYQQGGSFGGAAYPLELNPAASIQELVITSTGDAIVADIETVSSDTADDLTGIPLKGATLALDTIEMDSVSFRDPDGSGVETHGFWVGGQQG